MMIDDGNDDDDDGGLVMFGLSGDVWVVYCSYQVKS